MPVITYACQRRLMDATNDRVVTYELMYVEAQTTWKIFKTNDPAQVPPDIVIDPLVDEPIASCQVTPVAGFTFLFPPTSGWDPDIYLSIAKGCYVIVNVPGDDNVITPQRFYQALGERVDTVYQGTPEEQQITTTFFQQATYTDGINKDIPGPAPSPCFLFFKVTPALPGGFWVLSDTLGGEPIYASTTPMFPPNFVTGTAPVPQMVYNENWIASAYAPPRWLEYAGRTVGEAVQAISSVKVMTAVAKPNVTLEALGNDRIMNKLWEFFPKHYEMHHYPYSDNYTASGTGNETVTRSYTEQINESMGHTGARCNRSNPTNPVVEHHTHPETTLTDSTGESFTSSYSNLISPDLVESARYNRVDWVQHHGDQGGTPVGTYSYESSRVEQFGAELESSETVSKTGADTELYPGSSYLRIQPFSFQPENNLDYPSPYHAIGTYGEMEFGAEGRLHVNGTTQIKTRPNHVFAPHVEICPAADYEKYFFTYQVATGTVSTATYDSWEVCATALLKAVATPVGAAANQVFFGTQREFEEMILWAYLYDSMAPPTYPCMNVYDCCNYRVVNTNGINFNLLKSTKGVGSNQPLGISAVRTKIDVISKVQMDVPADDAHIRAPLATRDITSEEDIRIGSSHQIKGYNYGTLHDPHALFLHCPIRLEYREDTNSSYAEVRNSYKVLNEGTAKIYTDLRTVTVDYQRIQSKGLGDTGLVERNLTYRKVEVDNVVTKDITYNPATGEVTNIVTNEIDHVRLTTTDPTIVPGDEYDEVIYVPTATYTKASVDPSFARPAGTLLIKWSEHTEEHEYLYTQTHSTEVL